MLVWLCVLCAVPVARLLPLCFVHWVYVLLGAALCMPPCQSMLLCKVPEPGLLHAMLDWLLGVCVWCRLLGGLVVVVHLVSALTRSLRVLHTPLLCVLHTPLLCVQHTPLLLTPLLRVQALRA